MGWWKVQNIFVTIKTDVFQLIMIGGAKPDCWGETMTEMKLELGPGETAVVADITNQVVKSAQALSKNARKALIVCILRRFQDVIDEMKTKKGGNG